MGCVRTKVNLGYKHGVLSCRRFKFTDHDSLCTFTTCAKICRKYARSMQRGTHQGSLREARNQVALGRQSLDDSYIQSTTRIKGIKRIGPHRRDLFPIVPGGLLGGGHMEK